MLQEEHGFGEEAQMAKKELVDKMKKQSGELLDTMKNMKDELDKEVYYHESQIQEHREAINRHKKMVQVLMEAEEAYMQDVQG